MGRGKRKWEEMRRKIKCCIESEHVKSSRRKREREKERERERERERGPLMAAPAQQNASRGRQTYGRELEREEAAIHRGMSSQKGREFWKQ
jgi:hypothetical protein